MSSKFVGTVYSFLFFGVGPLTADFMVEKGRGRVRITTFERDRFNDLMQEFGVLCDTETYPATVFGRIELFPTDSSLGP